MDVLRILKCECPAHHLLAMVACDDEQGIEKELLVEMQNIKCPICDQTGPHKIVPSDQSFQSMEAVSEFMMDSMFDAVKKLNHDIAAMN